jgi:RecB family endonuclease NucS
MANSDEAFDEFDGETPPSDSGRDYPERALQDFLAKNPSALGIPNAKIIQSEYQTKVGRIDLLVNSGPTKLWVVELKAGKAGREAIGQIMSYIGAVSDENPDKEVFGLLAASDFDPGCLSAHRTVGEVELKKVRTQYVLEHFVSMKLHRGTANTNAAKIVKRPNAPEGTVCCYKCETQRQVSFDAQAFTCPRCGSFNAIEW